MSTPVEQVPSGEAAWMDMASSIATPGKGSAAPTDLGICSAATPRTNHRSRRSSALDAQYQATFAQAQHVPPTDARWDGLRTALAPLWDDAEIATALAAHDLTAVLRAVQGALGLSQRQLAVLTGQSQSEICDVLAGKRRIVSYQVLVRIADGLGIPRWRMGLSTERPKVVRRGSTPVADDATAGVRSVRVEDANPRSGGLHPSERDHRAV